DRGFRADRVTTCGESVGAGAVVPQRADLTGPHEPGSRGRAAVDDPGHRGAGPRRRAHGPRHTASIAFTGGRPRSRAASARRAAGPREPAWAGPTGHLPR